MVEQISNDNDSTRPDEFQREPDAHGQAAMLLVESLIHGLVARSVLRLEDAIEIVTVAAEVKADIGAELGDSPATLQKSLTMLGSIRASLANDTPGSETA